MQRLLFILLAVVMINLPLATDGNGQTDDKQYENLLSDLPDIIELWEKDRDLFWQIVHDNYERSDTKKGDPGKKPLKAGAIRK